jgi:hypothetical protein
MIDRTLTTEMVQMIEPASDAFLAMVDVAREFDPKEFAPEPLEPPFNPLPPSFE